MNREVNTIANLMSLRPPQRHSLEILDRVSEIISMEKGADLQIALESIRKEYSTVTDFERDFASLCFALATGVGKTRLMGAFITYLHRAHGFNNFFVLAPNLTIYNKLITDFTPNTSKYVFKGISEFAINAPNIITGDNYEKHGPHTIHDLTRQVNINIFNISKINSEVRGGKSPRIKRLSEYIGESYFDYLSGLMDLVLIMDESHRYRASSGVRALNELNPVLGLELTATPFIDNTRGAATPFKNVIYDYPLAKAMADGFVKEPAVVTQKNFDPLQHTPEEIELIKLQDGIHMHENVKVELETYARQRNERIVKPFMLVIARDTTHAGQLSELIKSEKFFNAQYKDKVIQVDSSRTGAEEDEMIQRLLAVESPDEPTEIVIHVNMLKEGWDVTNLYTIVPLRAANARTLIEQSIGRGLRLPYGKRTKVTAIDRLSIIAHDKFQEILDEANRADSVIKMQQIILDPENDMQRMVAVTVQPNIVTKLGIESVTESSTKIILSVSPEKAVQEFATPAEQKIALMTYELLKNHEELPSSSHLLQADIVEEISHEVTEALEPGQLELPGTIEKPDISKIVEKVAKLVVKHTIDIPRIIVVPKGEVTIGFHDFDLDASSINYQPVDQDIVIQVLRTNEQQTLRVNNQLQKEKRLEDYLVRSLIDIDEISYDDNSALLYKLSEQLVSHLRSYLPDDSAIRNVLIVNQKRLAEFIHAQMFSHQWEKAAGYEAEVRKGYTKLVEPTFKIADGAQPLDFRKPVEHKGRISQLIFGGFERCLYPMQKFDSDPERKMAIILDRDSEKWFRPAIKQFNIDYKLGRDQREYQPDFTAETSNNIYMVEVKASNELNDIEVQAKKDAAVSWCKHASNHTSTIGGKPWEYLLIPHDSIAENMSLKGLAARFTMQ